MSTDDPSVPYGYCHCGCGGKTNIIQKSWPREGWVKGEPRRYLPGHVGSYRQPKPIEWVEEDRGYETPCWIYQGRLNQDGYGKLGNHRGLAHRVVFVRERGELAKGRELDHLCRVRACVNPDHLEPVSHVENVRRGVSAKLNYEIACEIREQFTHHEGSQSAFFNEWAGQLHVTPGAIDHIVNYRCWLPPGMKKAS